MNRGAAATEKRGAITFERQAYIPPDLKQFYSCVYIASALAVAWYSGSSSLEVVTYFVVGIAAGTASILLGWVVLPTLSAPKAVEIGDDYVAVHYWKHKQIHSRDAVTLKERSNGSPPWWWTGDYDPDVRILINRRHAHTLLRGCWDLKAIKQHLPVVEAS